MLADEAGNTDFRPVRPGVSRYFILTMVTLTSYDIGGELLALRRELAWRGVGLDTEFHATEDKQDIRDQVFGVIQAHDFRIDATILEKSKTRPHLRHTHARFYQYAWFYHMKYVTARVLQGHDEIMVIGASMGTRKTRATFRGAIQDVMGQVAPEVPHAVASWACQSDPCLQVGTGCHIGSSHSVGPGRSSRCLGEPGEDGVGHRDPGAWDQSRRSNSLGHANNAVGRWNRHGVNGHRKLHRSGHRKLHTWRR